ncbi:MAG TPA: alpha-L-fucosidase [Polyangia bacterium]|nr:alpha-L-fucosidase [Polyangia bacterium]
MTARPLRVAAGALLLTLGACTGDRVVIGARTCPAPPDGPPAVAPLPTAQQREFQRFEMMAYIHFGLATYDQSPGAPASEFNPTSFDAHQWVSALVSAGFHQVVLVAKHYDGFCLWPSAYTDYSVKASPWRGGHGDVVREFTNAARAAGLRAGLYLSPWDENFPSTGDGYEAYLRNQVTELLSTYGPAVEMKFPGNHAPDGVDWAGVARLAHDLQPETLVWMGPEIATTGVDLRYIGNQTGVAPRSTASVADVPNGGPTNVWYPADAEVSERSGGLWFWTATSSVISLAQLQSLYFTSVGRNTTLMLNISPGSSGLLDADEVELLRQFGTWQADLYRTNLLRDQPVVADTTWAAAGFEASRALDDDLCTSWAAAAQATSARLEVTPRAPITFTVLSIREPIESGERATAYHIELRQNGIWNRAPTDASGAPLAGTVIGQRQLWQLAPTTVDAIALVIDAARGVPAVAELGAY